MATEQVFSEIRERSAQLQTSLKMVLDQLEGGYRPSIKAFVEIMTMNRELDLVFQKMLLDVAQLAGDGQSIPDNRTISEYEAMVRDSIKQQRISQFEEQKAALQRFAGVGSTSSKFTEVLKPFQEQVTNMLRSVTPETWDTDPQFIVQCDRVQAFLKVLDMPSQHRPEQEELMEELDRLFNPAVTRGLIFEKYEEAILEQVIIPDDTVDDHPSEPTALSSGLSDENTAARGRSKAFLETADGQASDGDVDQLPEVDDSGDDGLENSAGKTTGLLPGAMNTTDPDPDHHSDPADRLAPRDSEVEDKGIEIPWHKEVKANPLSYRTFMRDVERMRSYAKFLLPALTRFGVMTPSLALSFFRALGIKNVSDDELGKVARTFEQLAEKQFAAGYLITDSNDPVYCLTASCWNNMQNPNVKGKNQFWLTGIGHYKWLAEPKLRKAEIHRQLELNRRLVGFLENLKVALPDQFSMITRWINWDQDHYNVTIRWNGADKSCQLTDSTHLKESQPGRGILLLEEDIPPAGMIPDNGSEYYLLVQGQLYHWENGWVTENRPVPPDDRDTKRTSFRTPEESEASLESNQSSVPQSVQSDVKSSLIETVIIDRTENSENSPITDSVSIHPDHSMISNIQKQEMDNMTGMPENATVPEKIPYSELPESDEGLNDVSVELNFQEIVRQPETPSPEVMMELIQRRMTGPFDSAEARHRAVTEAVLLAKAAQIAHNDKPIAMKFLQLVYAANLGLADQQYTGEELSRIFEETDPEHASWKLGAYLNGLLFPAVSHDYFLRTQAGNLRDEFEFDVPDFEDIKPLIHELLVFLELLPGGFTEVNLQMLGEGSQAEQIMNGLSAEALRLQQEPTLKVMLTGIPEMIHLVFGPSSMIHFCLEHVEQNLNGDKAELKIHIHEQLGIPMDESLLSPLRLSEYIDNKWREATASLRTTKELKHKARKKIEDSLKERIDLIHQWIEFEADQDTAHLTKINRQKDRILQEMAELRGRLTVGSATNGEEFLVWVLDRVSDKLKVLKKQPPFADLLRSGRISLDERLVPLLDSSHQRVQYFEPWRRVLQHWDCSIPDLWAAAGLIFDDSSALFDNLNQYRQIQKVLNNPMDLPTLTEKTIMDSRLGADIKTNGFKGQLELDYMYGRVSENEKETILFQLESNHPGIFATENFAEWRCFLQALDQQAEDLARNRGLELKRLIERQIDSASDPDASKILESALNMLVTERNFTVAEEYLNRVISGDFSINKDLTIPEDDSFVQFISERVFDPLHQLSKLNTGKGLQNFGVDYLKNNFPANWTARYKEDSLQLIRSWPSDKQSLNLKQIRQLFTSLGFEVTNIQRAPIKTEEVYKLSFKKTSKNRADYLHPIATYGTMMKNFVNVVVLFGSYDAKRLVDKVTSLNLGQNTIVLLDAHLDRGARRSVAEILHTQNTQQNAFLVIDRILALHLALHQITERIPVMLKSTLPYSFYQPFVRDGGSTADEMFFGRNRELSTIIDSNGASVVYGGRQLGKTALLERAESRVHNPEANTYAVYSNIINCRDEASFVEKVISDINQKTDLGLGGADSIQALCDMIRLKIRTLKIQTLLLLLDEADNFLEAISTDHYRALQPLIDLKRETKNEFKMVLAGLHNVSRAKNATTQNGVFGQLGTPLCIKPLSPLDALQLIKTPLLYLGYELDKSPQIEMILTNTNYYPGILQFFGYTLVQNKPQQYREHYRAAAGHPPYPLQDDQLGSIMNSEDLNQSIKEKFKLSLNLDPRYFMLARCITLKTYEDEGRAHSQSGGYSAEELKAYTDSFPVASLSDHSDREIRNLLDEMVDMGILSTQNNLYRLRRQAFAGIIATDMNHALEGLMEEEG